MTTSRVLTVRQASVAQVIDCKGEYEGGGITCDELSGKAPDLESSPKTPGLMM